MRHTIDVWAAQADPGPAPAFTAFRLSQYRSGGVPGSQTIQQLEFSPPNLPIFRAGSSPFMGDYLDVATEAPFVRNGSTWSFNTAAAASPVFHGIWTDNRDIRPPANGRWTDYTPPIPPFARPTMSGFDPTQAIPPCVAGQAGMRNQNIYTARITRGLVVGAIGNSRRLGAVQRSFPVFAQNNGTTIRSYRLTITNQPAGGQASFKQFEQLATLDVRVPPKSTVARTVFARSTDPHAQINVSVVEVSAPNGAPVPNGQRGTIVLNPDPTNPDLENPDLENPDLENPDLENAEVHNPDLENATVRNPDLENPDLENPDLENPDLENTTVVNTSILNPDLENPDLENPDLENPDLENPDLENVDLINGALSDTTWVITNKGNTAGSYTVKLALNRLLPLGFRSQLLAHKVYQTPAALGCSLLKQSQTVLLANIPNPRFAATGELLNPDLENPDLENLTIAIAPGETARITLRVFDPNRHDAVTFRAAESVTPVAVAQAVNTPEANQGITQPAAAGVLTSNAPVPGSAVGGAYATTLTSVVPGTWTVSGGTVPPGLVVNPATGQITGTPTASGTFTFTAQFRSPSGLIDYRTVTITVGAVGTSADVAVSAVAPTDPVAVGANLPYTLHVSNLGPAAATSVELTDTLPEGTTFVSAATSLGSCRHANGTLVCTLGTLASGGSATVVLTVRPTISGAHINQAVVSADSADPIASNNTAVTTTTAVLVVGPSAFVVTNTLNGGAGSLRQAILDANANAGPDTITFAIPGAGLHQILPLAAGLPAITDPVTIDATTQPGFVVGGPVVELNGGETSAGANGLVINAGASVVRGLIINRFPGSGIVLQGGDSNIVVGNWIGTTASGGAPAGNGNGILILSSANSIGGQALAERNVISGNTNGVQIGQSALGNSISGNLIGTDATGTLDVGNVQAGVLVIGEANAIGGPGGSRNVISGNGEAGVRLGGGASGNSVQNNFIGTDLSGLNPLPNLVGVSIGINPSSSASSNVIGGVTAGTGNLIAFNTSTGVSVSSGGTNNAIFGNAIHSNGALGIDLNADGVTANDPGDGDTGANDLQNFPVLAAASGGVQGTLSSAPASDFRIEFFGSAACDASGNGEGATFLGAMSVATDATGLATIPLFTTAAGQFVTATATDPSNNTSEFSACVQTGEQPEIAITATDPDAAELGSNTGTVVVTRTGPTTLERDVVVSITGSAINNSDYEITSAALVGAVNPTFFTLRIPAGQTTAAVTVTPIFSPEVEGSETVILTAEGNPVTVTIADEPAIALTATDPAAAELGSNTGTVVVTRTGPATYDRDVVINLTGTAINNSDYEISSPALVGDVNPSFFTLRIPAGQTTATVTVTPLFSPAVEGSETVVLTAESTSATVTIADEPAVTLTATDPDAAELGTNTATVVATRTGPTTYDRDVVISLAGSAVNSSDYLITSPALLGSVNPSFFTLRLIAGQATATVTVTPIADGLAEGPETVVLTAEGAVATVTIVDEFVGLTFPVITTANSGPGSLRQAILDANTSPGNDLITFAIPGAGVHTIALQEAPLPPITGTVTIDGTTQPGWSGLPLVEIDGTNAGPAANGLVITGNSTTVQALAINRFGTLGGAGSPGGSGIVVQGAGSHRVLMNFIGVDATGTLARPNRGNGIVVIDSPDNRIGGTSPFRNVVSANGGAGILLSGIGTTSTTIASNFVGTSVTGTAALANANGIVVTNAGSNTIGGALGGNVISGNTSSGVVIGGNAQLNLVIGNFIGTNLQGAPLGNGTRGVLVTDNAHDNRIGGIFLSGSNVIAFNAQAGVQIESGTNNAVLVMRSLRTEGSASTSAPPA